MMMFLGPYAQAIGASQRGLNLIIYIKHFWEMFFIWIVSMNILPLVG